ncbi:hypothetical protein AVEN_83731-1, partial [Araneus ventricosus]
MPETMYLTLEQAVQRLFEDDSDDDKKSVINVVVFSPENAEASDEEERNVNISNYVSDDLPCATAVEIVVRSKKKFEPSE